jgi:hypothetical protein
MTDQPTTTERMSGDATTAEPAGDERRRETEQPSGTRELRDAQEAQEKSSRGPTSMTQDRPPIRAESGKVESAATAEAPLFDDAAGRELRERWLVIQTEFVDEPRAAVQKADSLVAEVLKQLTDSFARERASLEAGWSHEEASKKDVTTEDLRQAIRRYRSFFNRLLSI